MTKILEGSIFNIKQKSGMQLYNFQLGHNFQLKLLVYRKSSGNLELAELVSQSLITEYKHAWDTYMFIVWQKFKKTK